MCCLCRPILRHKMAFIALALLCMSNHYPHHIALLQQGIVQKAIPAAHFRSWIRSYVASAARAHLSGLQSELFLVMGMNR